ncbi:peptidoglycan DD-metalloendopeptidase family protein [Parvularcula sp. ZS-1/3]|uniref:Peptidoglycan DD-metalloendopeptidase family protein n=1 Tax=Parvularcula mediterranea TaxID=2732508 RepID=A0A7Y3RPU1_9PROT|nr:M23 family metallopeptidase [Parvularcula mediterranea]NNU17157.1 peptidoglycan DD-metalloendopeptidase family protein [Parvularcula mediterranea]
MAPFKRQWAVRDDMGKDKGSVSGTLGHLFRERQIYHRSDGIVHFIKLSSRTQIVFASILLGALMWVAYASVNVVFKEQIIVAKDEQRRDEQAAYRRRLQNSERAYEEVSSLNFIYSREFEAALKKLEGQHDALRSLVENKSSLDVEMRGLAETLSAAGAPGGRKLSGSNRVMIDPVGREPTPRQSRVSALREEALESVIDQEIAEGIENEVLSDMRRKTAQLSASQVVLLAGMEEKMHRAIREMDQILRHTGAGANLIAKADETLGLQVLAQARGDDGSDLVGIGGPFIPVDEEGATEFSGTYYETAARVQERLTELAALAGTIRQVPLASPVLNRHRQTSGFGLRWDPFKRSKRARHYGLDFAAARRTPIVATAPGRVVFAGTRGAYGKLVEIDHGNGFRTRYAHLHTIKTRAGSTVGLNDVIGLMGSTGRSTATHLHYEVHYNRRQVDPERFIEAGRYVFES